MHEILKNKLVELEKLGVKESRRPNRIVVKFDSNTEKKNGDLRLCLDPRRLNLAIAWTLFDT